MFVHISDLGAPELAEEGIQGPGELPQPLGLEPRQLREQQQQNWGPGVTVDKTGYYKVYTRRGFLPVGLATQREEVADHLQKMFLS